MISNRIDSIKKCICFVYWINCWLSCVFNLCAFCAYIWREKGELGNLWRTVKCKSAFFETQKTKIEIILNWFIRCHLKLEYLTLVYDFDVCICLMGRCGLIEQHEMMICNGYGNFRGWNCCICWSIINESNNNNNHNFRVWLLAIRIGANSIVWHFISRRCSDHINY